MQVKTLSRPRQRHQLSQLHKRKVFAPFYIFLLEPYVGTIHVNTSLVSCFKPLQLQMKKPFSTFFSFWNAGKNAQSSTSATSAQPVSQTEGICTILHIPFGTICRDCMSTPVWCHVLRQYSFRWRNLSVSFFFFSCEMRVKTPSRPRQRHLLSQLHNRKVFTPYHIFLLEPCVGTVCQHKFGIMF